MKLDELEKMAQKTAAYGVHPSGEYIYSFYTEQLQAFARLVAKQQREEDAKLVESMTLEWPDQPEFAQVERTTIQDCAKIIRQRAITYDWTKKRCTRQPALLRVYQLQMGFSGFARG